MGPWPVWCPVRAVVAVCFAAALLLVLRLGSIAMRLPAMRAAPLPERGTSGSTYQWALGSSAVGSRVGDVGLLVFSCSVGAVVSCSTESTRRHMTATRSCHFFFGLIYEVDCT